MLYLIVSAGRFKLERAGSQASSLTRPAGFQPAEYYLAAYRQAGSLSAESAKMADFL
jgi:hypothetical protein